MKNMFINMALVSMMVFPLFVCADENNTEYVYRDSIKLRHGYGYNLGLVFNARNEIIQINQVKFNFNTDGDYSGDGKIPSIDYTAELKKNNNVLQSESKQIVQLSRYNINYRPIKRAKDNIKITYDTMYRSKKISTDNPSEHKHIIDYQPYEVTSCGDGIVDDFIDISGDKIHEECDPGDGNWENSGCKINECTLLKR